jgi:chemotaxis protein methyltransferase CheR
MDVSDSTVRILAGLLEARTGQQLTLSRRWRVESALAALMRARGFTSLDELIAAMLAGADPDLATEVVEGLLNNETYFFRDRNSFDLLLGGAIERLRKERASEKRLTIWSAGCSTGQEAYSLAMSFAEEEERWAGWRITILGTDISGQAVRRATEGLYSQFEVQRGLPVLKLIKWFDEEGGGQWRISEPLRRMVRFEQHALASEPPAPGRFDVILCRNVLLYFSAAGRRAVFDKLAEASAPGACLMLGASETVIGQTDRFVSDPELRGLYRLNGEAAPEQTGAAGRRRSS